MSSSGSATRRCSRQTCTRDAVMTLTYVYSDSTAVVGPLAGHAEPHAYDLCAVHADRLTVPRGWRVVRLELPETRARREDIGAVAEAVREAEPPAPVRGRSRRVLRDVSLPRPSALRPAIPEDPQGGGPETARTDPPEDVPDSAAGTTRQAGPEVVWHDVPVPGTLRRAHLRRPTVRGSSPRPEV